VRGDIAKDDSGLSRVNARARVGDPASEGARGGAGGSPPPLRAPSPSRCRACGAPVEWIPDGSRAVPVDPGTRIPVLPGRGQYVCYPEGGVPVVGRLVRGPDRMRPGVQWGRTLHWATCPAVGARDKMSAVGAMDHELEEALLGS